MALIERRELLARLVDERVVGLEAPSGFGKSTLIAQLAAALDLPVVRVELRSDTSPTELVARLRAAATRAGLVAVAHAFDPAAPDESVLRLAATQPLFIAVDEIQLLSSTGAEWLSQLANEASSLSFLFSGRRLPGPLTDGVLRDGTVLTTADLRFDEHAVRLALIEAGVDADDAAARDVLRLTDGWPAAVQLLGRAMTRGASGIDPVTSEGALRSLVDQLTAKLDENFTLALRELAALPLISADVATAVAGPRAFERLLDTGLPLRTRADGWHVMPDAIRDALRPIAVASEHAIAIAPLYARADEIVEAAQLLWRAGDWTDLCVLIADQPRANLQRAGLALLEPIVESIPDATLAANPTALVQLIRAAERHERLRARWVQRAQSVVAADSPAGRAIAVEKALGDARNGALVDARAVVERVLHQAAEAETLTIGRARLVRAYTLIVGETVNATTVALSDLEQAAARFRLAGDRAWEADAYQAAGFGCHYTSGNFEAAIELLERSLALRPAPDAGRSQALTYVAEVMLRRGQLDEAAVALREARVIAARISDPRSIAYVAWTSAELHAQRRDAQLASAALAEAEAHSGDVLGSLAGIDFLVDSARIRMVVGDASGARRDLERAEELARGTERQEMPLAARARYEILFGDARAALTALDQLDQSHIVYRGERWSRLLLRAAALARLDDRQGAAANLSQMRAALGEQDDPERAARLEPELLAIAEAQGQAPGAPGELESATARITMLGGFSVVRGARDVTPLPGRPQTLVKLLALRRTLTTDEAIELLWPEVDEEVGRARLRNLLNRVRSVSGPVIERRGEALTLADEVTIDAQRFEEAAALALSAPRDERAGLARRALAWSTGELLPADRYVDWADVPRERLRRRRLALLDLVADDAAASGELDEAARLLDEAIGDDPLEEIRYTRLARALLAQGRTRAARGVVERGIAAAHELGVEPQRELIAVLGAIADVEGAR